MGTRVVSVTAAVASAVAILSAAVSGCTASRGQKEMPGVVAGFAVPCVGAAVASQLQVRVSANEHGHTVATVLAKYHKDRGRYRLVLPPGRYVIGAQGPIEPPRSVALHAGEHITINFPDRCK